MALISPLKDSVTYRGKTFKVGEEVDLWLMDNFCCVIRRFVPTAHYSGRVLDYVEVSVRSAEDAFFGITLRAQMRGIKKKV